MINSGLIQTLVIDTSNLKINNREKIIGGDSFWRPTEAAKKQIFLTFLTSFYQKVVSEDKLLAPIGSSNH